MALRTITICILDAQLHGVVVRAASDLGYKIDDAIAIPHNQITDQLVAKQPQLILVEMNPALDWLNFITIASASPATRKMPILAIGDLGDSETQRASKAGCEAVVPTSEFVANAAQLIQRYAKADEGAELARQALLPLPQLAHKAIEQFNQHEFWEQHETFEELWRAEPGPVRQMYQGILQVGVAYLQIQRKNYVGARKLFQRARQYLNVLPDVCQGVDVAQFKMDAQAAQNELERLGVERISEFPAVLFRPVKVKGIGSQ